MKKRILPFLVFFSALTIQALSENLDSLKTARIAELEALKPVFKSKSGWHDSVFAMVYSDDHINYKNEFRAADFPGTADEFAKSKKGQIIGPVVKDNSVYLLKIIGRGTNFDSVQVRHLLIAYKGAARATALRTKEQAKSMADSLLKLVLAGKVKLEDIVTNLTDDPGSKAGNLGNYGWFTKTSGFVQPFKDAGFNNAVGKTILVETDFGYHIIQVLQHSTERPYVSAYTIMRYIDWNLVNQVVNMAYYATDPMKMMVFPGGENALQQYIRKNVKYPAYELSHGLEGCAKIQLEIDSKGKVTEAYLMAGGLDGTVFMQPALDLALSLPAFVPSPDVKAGQIIYRTLYVNFRKEEYGK